MGPLALSIAHRIQLDVLNDLNEVRCGTLTDINDRYNDRLTTFF